MPAGPEDRADRSLQRPVHDLQKIGAAEENEAERESLMPASSHLICERTAALAGAFKVIKRLNRNTTWVAAGLLSCVLFAALMLVFQEHEQTDDLTPSQATLAGDDGSKNLKSAELSQSTNSPPKNTSVTAAKPVNSVYPALTAKANVQPDQKTNEISEAAHKQDLAQATGAKVNKVRHLSIGRRRLVSAKMRLVALWHQSLSRDASTRSWLRFSNLNQGVKKKISYNGSADH